MRNDSKIVKTAGENETSDKTASFTIPNTFWNRPGQSEFSINFSISGGNRSRSAQHVFIPDNYNTGFSIYGINRFPMKRMFENTQTRVQHFFESIQSNIHITDSK